MSHERPGKGEDFIRGEIADEHLRCAHHQHEGTQFAPTTILCGATAGILPTCAGHVCQPQISADCCWIIIATTNCTTTRPNGATCCWRFLATTDCTSTLPGGAACCWEVLGTTNCTSFGRNCDD